MKAMESRGPNKRKGQGDDEFVPIEVLSQGLLQEAGPSAECSQIPRMWSRSPTLVTDETRRVVAC